MRKRTAGTVLCVCRGGQAWQTQIVLYVREGEHKHGTNAVWFYVCVGDRTGIVFCTCRRRQERHKHSFVWWGEQSRHKHSFFGRGDKYGTSTACFLRAGGERKHGTNAIFFVYVMDGKAQRRHSFWCTAQAQLVLCVRDGRHKHGTNAVLFVCGGGRGQAWKTHTVVLCAGKGAKHGTTHSLFCGGGAVKNDKCTFFCSWRRGRTSMAQSAVLCVCERRESEHGTNTVFVRGGGGQARHKHTVFVWGHKHKLFVCGREGTSTAQT